MIGHEALLAESAPMSSLQECCIMLKCHSPAPFDVGDDSGTDECNTEKDSSSHHGVTHWSCFEP